MPFAMIHVNIALNIIRNCNVIKEPEQFLLGSLAPDSVHFMDGYNSWMKHKSHYCVGPEPWGCVTNNDEWLENVRANAARYEGHKEQDFYLGYFTHILTDLRNNIRVWMPFKEIVKNDDTPGIGKRYHEESNLMDIWLYYRADPEINDLLEQSHAVEIDDIPVESVAALKKSFLYERFISSSDVEMDLSKNQYVKVEEVQAFIEEESEYIRKVLFAL